ncbi:MAG: DUF1425 domain-containing protein [Planctomycetes bacterium]|nr:DUF1425 domain-containing protein [Planctomycetota bacterium]
MRHALWALIVLAGCGGESIHPPDEWREEAGNEGTDVNIDPAKLNNPTSELGTDRVRAIAKTIEWLPIGTEEGATYNNEGLIVDRILRDDAENNYAVRVRLKNATKDVQKAQYLIRFYHRSGAQIAGYVGGIGSQERWQGVIVEPYGYATVSDFARVMGAEGFRLYVKGGGGSADGSPDDPATRDERRAKKAAGAK